MSLSIGFDYDPATPEGVAPSDPLAIDLTQGYGGRILHGRSPDERKAILSYVCLFAGKPESELTYTDMMRAMDALGGVEVMFDQRGSVTSTDWVLNDEGLRRIQMVDDVHFLGKGIPIYPPGSAAALDYDLSGLPESGDANKAAVLVGTSALAVSIYNTNYGQSTDLKPISFDGLTSQQAKDLQELLEAMFGKDVAFNTGHLNTLKLMGLVQGSGTAEIPAKSWSVTGDKGKMILDAYREIKGIQPPPPNYIPDVALMLLGEERWNEATAVAATYFDDKGFRADRNLVDLQAAAKLFAKTLTEAGSIGKVDLAGASPEVLSTLNALFGKTDGNTSFTVAEINTALAMGFITRTPGGDPAYAVTTIGTHLATKAKEVATPPAPDTAPAEKVKALEEKLNCLKLIEKYKDRLDTAKEGGDPDGMISDEDLRAILDADPSDISVGGLYGSGSRNPLEGLSDAEVTEIKDLVNKLLNPPPGTAWVEIRTALVSGSDSDDPFFYTDTLQTIKLNTESALNEAKKVSSPSGPAGS